MSIIYDALKKVEKGKSFLSSGEKETYSKKSFFFKKMSLLIPVSVLFVAAFFLSYNFDWGNFTLRQSFKENNREEKTKFTLAKPLERKRDAVEEGVFRRESPTNRTYRLEGIIFGQDAPFAVVNGRRVEEKDKLGNLVVTKINRHSIELRDLETEEKKSLFFEF